HRPRPGCHPGWLPPLRTRLVHPPRWSATTAVQLPTRMRNVSSVSSSDVDSSSSRVRCRSADSDHWGWRLCRESGSVKWHLGNSTMKNAAGHARTSTNRGDHGTSHTGASPGADRTEGRPGGQERTYFSTKITLSSLRESAIDRISEPPLHQFAVGGTVSVGSSHVTPRERRKSWKGDVGHSRALARRCF